MRVGVIRTGGLPSVRTGAGAIEPRLDVASFSDPPASAFGIALNRIISAFRVLRPIERKAIANKPFAEVGAADQTGCNRAAIWVEAARQAINRTTSDEAVEVVCCLRATAILQTVLAAAQLAALRRVDAPERPRGWVSRPAADDRSGPWWRRRPPRCWAAGPGGRPTRPRRRPSGVAASSGPKIAPSRPSATETPTPAPRIDIP
jgi:hypothetical protein